MARRPRLPIYMKMLAILSLLLSIATLVPNPEASKASILGYKALCTFAPGSSLILFFGYLFAGGYAKKQAQKGE